LPTTFNHELIVVVFNVVFPETFNDDLRLVILSFDELIVVALLNVVFPETVKVDTNVEGLLNLPM
jgi:hypothetical protein